MSRKKKLIIVLTGGIGSGKSTVAKEFERLGANVIDADHISREIVRPGSDVLNRIHHHFGDEILNDDESLNRSRLQYIIFNDEQARLWLEDLLHPIICHFLIEQAKKSPAPCCILVIPLYIELLQKKSNGGFIACTFSEKPYIDVLIEIIDRVCVVDTSKELQIERIQKRNKLSNDEIQNIFSAQVARDKRLANADDIIDNTADLDSLKKQVHELHQFYLEFIEKN